jgi:hypothetical protein
VLATIFGFWLQTGSESRFWRSWVLNNNNKISKKGRRGKRKGKRM